MWRSLKFLKNDLRMVNLLSSKSTTSADIILKSDVQIPLVQQDLISYIFPKFEKRAHLDALVCGETGQKITYGELLQKSLRWGGALKRLVPSMDSETPKRALIFSRNNLEYAPFVYGTMAAGWTVITMNAGYTTHESTVQLDECKPDVIVVETALENIAEEALRNCRMDIPLLTIGPSAKGRLNFQDLISVPENQLCNISEVSPSDTSTIVFSGGTTGKPKGVLISHSAMANGMESITHEDFYPIGSEKEFIQHNYFSVLPFYHIYGLFLLMHVQLSLGCKGIVLKGFDPNTFAKMLETHQIGMAVVVPTIMNFLANSPLVTKDHLKHVQYCLIGAAPVMTSTAQALMEKVGHEIIFQEGFGLTEGLVAHLTPHKSGKLGYIGKLTPNCEAKIIDLNTNKSLGPEKTGELLIRSPMLTKGYLNNPKATSDTIDADGFLHTGDVAFYTPDGYFSIVDRIKELIKVKGHQVSPSELEDSLMLHPSVAEAGVIGIPDEKSGEKPKAFVVLKGKATKDDIKKYIEERFSKHKWLTGGVEFVDQLPKSHVGKLLRRKLKEI